MVIINRPRAAPMSDRGLDLYESPDVATIALLSAEPELLEKFVFEPCCGRNAITRVLRATGISVFASDIVDYGTAGQDGQADFFATTTLPDGRITAIVSNPPYGRKLAARFVRHALMLVPDVYALLPLTFLEIGGPRGHPSLGLRVSSGFGVQRSFTTYAPVWLDRRAGKRNAGLCLDVLATRLSGTSHSRADQYEGSVAN